MSSDITVPGMSTTSEFPSRKGHTRPQTTVQYLTTEIVNSYRYSTVPYSVADPWHFCVDPDPCLWLMDSDADPDPAIFVNELQDANKKLIKKKLFCLLLFEGTFTSFFKEKSQSSRNQVFSYHFTLVIEGTGSGSISMNNGSGSGSRRPKNIRIRWIRILIRIRNTGTVPNMECWRSRIFFIRPTARPCWKN
jgi:hypothetical protein